VTDIRILLPAGLPLPNANKKVHWGVRYRQQQQIKRKTYQIVKLMRIKPMSRCEITVVVHPDVRTRRFDPPNWGDSGKPAIDALTDAGVIVDDSSRYVPRVSYVAGDPVPGWRLELILTPLPGIHTSM
jgi:hypothetical protein